METGIELIDLYVTPWLGKIALALVIFLTGKWVVDHLHKVLVRLLQRSSFDDTLVKFLGHLSYGFLIIAVALAAVSTAGVNISSLLALIGAAGLAVGLALKDSLSNLAAGVMIIVFRPFKVGDFINTAGHGGSVDEIGIFSTMLKTPDNQRIIIPNSSVISSTIVNVTALPTRRLDLIISISYEDSISTAKQVIAEVLASEPRLLAEPAALVGVDKLADSSVDIFIKPWVNTDDYWAVRAALLENLKESLDAAGIEIPYVKRTLYLKETTPTV